MPTPEFPWFTPFAGLAAALGIGLLFGLERGWSSRGAAEGRRVAGLRTFSLIGLLGGVLASLGGNLGVASVAAGLLGLAGLMALAWREAAQREGALSATTAVAALLTFALGALAAHGLVLPALASAMVAVVLLNLKSTLHGGLRLIEQQEFRAGLQMGVISLVVLPLLPDQGYGPWGVLNPYRIWWAVVLLAALSLLGHVVMRWAGGSRGVLLTGLVGGLASSTAATLALARRARAEPQLLQAALAGALASTSVMCLRVEVLALLLQPRLGWALAAPLVAGALVLGLFARWHWRRRGGSAGADMGTHVAPFDLGTVLGFALVLGLVLLLVEAAKHAFGDSGILAVAALSGSVDIDPVVISLARLWDSQGVAPQLPVRAVLLACLGALASKLLLAFWAGGAGFALRLGLGYLACAVGGGLVGVLGFNWALA